MSDGLMDGSTGQKTDIAPAAGAEVEPNRETEVSAEAGPAALIATGETPPVESQPPAHIDAPVEELDALTASADQPGPADEHNPDEGAALESAPVEGDVVIQAAFELEDTKGELAPDIQIESRGRRLGLTTVLESLLFVSDEAVEVTQLAKALDTSIKVVEAGLVRLDKLYTKTGRGLRVQEREGRYQLVSAPECASAIEDFLNLDLTTKLSGPALEALAVIAYRQPVTRAQVEAVRGVDCAGVLRSLAQRGLIEEVGRLDTVGRPILYGVTDLFMQHFGLLKLGELPPLELDEADMLWAATELAEMEVETV